MDKHPHVSILRLLFLGDVVGEPGRKAVASFIPQIREDRGVDFVVVNGENSEEVEELLLKLLLVY